MRKREYMMEVNNVRVHPDDVNDLIALGVNFFGPDRNLRAVFPEGTVRQNEQSFTLPGGSQLVVDNGLLMLTWRTW